MRWQKRSNSENVGCIKVVARRAGGSIHRQPVSARLRIWQRNQAAIPPQVVGAAIIAVGVRTPRPVWIRRPIARLPGRHQSCALVKIHHRIALPVLQPHFNARNSRRHTEPVKLHLATRLPIGEHQIVAVTQRAGQHRHRFYCAAQCITGVARPVPATRSSAGIGRVLSLAGHQHVIAPRSHVALTILRQQRPLLIPGFHHQLATERARDTPVTIGATNVRQIVPLHLQQHLTGCRTQVQLPVRRVVRHHYPVVIRFSRRQGQVAHAPRHVQIPNPDRIVRQPNPPALQCVTAGAICILHPNVIRPGLQRIAHPHLQHRPAAASRPIRTPFPIVAAGPRRGDAPICCAGRHARPTPSTNPHRQRVPAHHHPRTAVAHTHQP